MAGRRAGGGVLSWRSGPPALALTCGVLAASATALSAQANEPPVISTVGPFTVAEGDRFVAGMTATDPDTPVGSLVWSIPAGAAGGADGGKFAFSGANLNLVSPGDYETPDDADSDRTWEVTVQVSDGNSAATADLEVTLSNVLELLLAITGPSSRNYAENGALRVAAYRASSPEDHADVAWSLSGADGSDFSIDDGVLRFQGLPDFEAAADSDVDNEYEVTVEASDGTNERTADVTVTVTDRDEPGTVTLDSDRPRLGTALTASLVDPDGNASNVSWLWERSAGRGEWGAIAGAASSAYSPVAADAGRYLRVTASYTDSDHGDGKTAATTLRNVVTAGLLSSLAVTTSSPGAGSAFPAFDPETLHYAIRCGSPAGAADTMTIRLSAKDSDSRVSVAGRQTANRNAVVSLAVDGGGRIGAPVSSDVPITVAGGDGAGTTYVVHCVPRVFPRITSTRKAGASVDLFTTTWGPTDHRSRDSIAIMDANGVPRFERFVGSRVLHFRTQEDGAHPYTYMRFTGTVATSWGRARANTEGVLLDKHLAEQGTVKILPVTRPDGFDNTLTHTDSHDLSVDGDGNHILISYDSSRRDMSDFDDSNGDPYATDEGTEDSVIQVVSPDRMEQFYWNSWDHMAIEDCTQHRFPPGYAHLNSLQAIDGDIVGSFRGCSQVLRIDPDGAASAGYVVWRLGKSRRSRAEWLAADDGPPPLDIVGDPQGEFCGQHAARIIENGHLLLFDNGGYCVGPRTSGVFARAAEYALDVANGEAIFVRDHSYGGRKEHYTLAGGHVERMASGNWLISWGRGDSDPATGLAPEQSVTEWDPETGDELFAFKMTNLTDEVARDTRAYPVDSAALAEDVVPLAAVVGSGSSSSLHRGAADRPRVIVAFNQPVADPASADAWTSVTGATIADFGPHVAAGAPAHAYLFTLAPSGTGAVEFSLVPGVSCQAGGVCTADGRNLVAAPAAWTIVYSDGSGDPGGGGGGGGGGQPDDEDDQDDGGGGGGQPPSGGGGPDDAEIATDAACADGLCRVRTGVAVEFRDMAGGFGSRLWDFGDGTLSWSAAVTHSWTEPGFYTVTLEKNGGAARSTSALTFLVEAAEPAGTCVPGAETRCLQDSRYAVRADWRTASGESGAGLVVRSGTNDAGLFRFFDPANWEVLIKVLDGCAVNGHVWVYGASTTDLGYTITVTDTATGAAREYRNEPGQPATAIADAAAFGEGCRP